MNSRIALTLLVLVASAAGGVVIAILLAKVRAHPGQAEQPNGQYATHRAVEERLERKDRETHQPLVVVSSSTNTTPYDSVKHVREADSSPRTVFENEPRDNTWAEEYEQTLRSLLMTEIERLEADAEIATLECRTSSCAITLRVPVAEVDRFMSIYPVPMMGDIGSVGGPTISEEDAEIPFYVLFSPENRDSSAYARWYENRRKEVLAELAGPEATQSED